MNWRTRKTIDRHKFAYFIIEGDPFGDNEPGFLPSNFDSKTLEWVMRSATLIVLWGGDIPFSQERFIEALKAHVRPDGKIAIALLRDAHLDEWARFAYEHAQEAVELFAIKGLPGVATKAKRRNCPTSGAIH